MRLRLAGSATRLSVARAGHQERSSPTLLNSVYRRIGRDNSHYAAIIWRTETTPHCVNPPILLETATARRQVRVSCLIDPTMMPTATSHTELSEQLDQLMFRLLVSLSLLLVQRQ
jgi:hypothetical protein